MPLSYQPENWVLGRRKPHRVATWPASDLEALCDHPATLWANGHSTSHGHWDCIPEGPGSCDGASLFLIPLSDPHFVVQPEYRGKLKCRVGFRYRDSQYSLTVQTPPVKWLLPEARPLSFSHGRRPLRLHQPRSPFQGRHYNNPQPYCRQRDDMTVIYTVGHSHPSRVFGPPARGDITCRGRAFSHTAGMRRSSTGRPWSGL